MLLFAVVVVLCVGCLYMCCLLLVVFCSYVAVAVCFIRMFVVVLVTVCCLGFYYASLLDAGVPCLMDVVVVRCQVLLLCVVVVCGCSVVLFVGVCCLLSDVCGCVLDDMVCRVCCVVGCVCLIVVGLVERCCVMFCLLVVFFCWFLVVTCCLMLAVVFDGVLLCVVCNWRF